MTRDVGGGGCVGPGCRAQPAPVVRATPTPTSLTTAPRMRTRGRPVPVPMSVPVPVPVQRTTVVEELAIVDPVRWGPAMWRFLHIASENSAASPTRKGVWDVLLNAMLTGLPCPECTEHYTAWYVSHPFVIPARGANVQVAAREWVRGLHNAVNVRRGLPEWSAEAVEVVYGPGQEGGARGAAREALAAAEAEGVGSWVIAAGREVVARAMV